MIMAAKLGTGARFAALTNKLANRKVGQTARGKKMAAALPGKTGPVKNPAALAAFIGRKKFGKAAFQKMAVKGKTGAK